MESARMKFIRLWCLWICALALAACNSDKAETTDAGTPSGGAADGASPDVEKPDSSVDGDGGGVTISDGGTPATGVTLDECITSDQPGDHVFDCSRRKFDVMVPAACIAGGCGMVVDVHGLTMSGRMQDNNTEMRRLGAKYNYVVVQPNARPAPPEASWDPKIDDEKIVDFMQRAIKAWRIDPKRVHFTGFSQGGFMTWRFICNHSDLISSAAPGAACGMTLHEGCTFTGEQSPQRKISILYMHGTKDRIVGYPCALPQRDAVVKWLGASGPGEKTKETATFRHTTWKGVGGAEMHYLEHDYEAESNLIAGHCYPGSKDDGKMEGQIASFACKPPVDFHWGEAVMEFFRGHPL
ncbi:MAG: hypothetical protein GMKNLPBB_00198 [Myxococcota bacterium]|nr:hypothetical protein [Myxococcota bacterium]